MMIRPGVTADIESMRHIEVRAGELFIEVGMPEIAAHPPGDAEDYAEAEALLVAEVEGDLVGYAWIDLVDGETYLEQLSVLPEHGGQGVGTALLDAVATWARARGDRSVTLTTFREVPFNGPLYARRGFVEVPETEWTDSLEEIIAFQASLGMERSSRVVMRRPVD